MNKSPFISNYHAYLYKKESEKNTELLDKYPSSESWLFIVNLICKHCKTEELEKELLDYEKNDDFYDNHINIFHYCFEDVYYTGIMTLKNTINSRKVAESFNKYEQRPKNQS